MKNQRDYPSRAQETRKPDGRPFRSISRARSNEQKAERVSPCAFAASSMALSRPASFALFKHSAYLAQGLVNYVIRNRFKLFGPAQIQRAWLIAAHYANRLRASTHER